MSFLIKINHNIGIFFVFFFYSQMKFRLEKIQNRKFHEMKFVDSGFVYNVMIFVMYTGNFRKCFECREM